MLIKCPSGPQISSSGKSGEPSWDRSRARPPFWYSTRPSSDARWRMRRFANRDTNNPISTLDCDSERTAFPQYHVRVPSGGTIKPN